MGAGVSLSTFVNGTVASSAALNTNLSNINNAPKFFYGVGSLSGVAVLVGNTSSPTNFTNPFGALPDFAFGNSVAGAFHLTCWNQITSTSSIIVTVPDSNDGGTTWGIVLFQF